MTDIIQVKSGTIDGATSASVTFDSGTQAGSTVILYGFAAPSSGTGFARFWTPTGGAGSFTFLEPRTVGSDAKGIITSWVQQNVADAETTYTFPIDAGTTAVGCWIALEVVDLEVTHASLLPYLTASSGVSMPGSPVASATTTAVPESAAAVSTAYHSLAMGAWGAYNASSTQPVISNYTGNLYEAAQVAVTASGGAFSLAFALATGELYDIGRFTRTADVSPSCYLLGDLVLAYARGSRYAPIYDAMTGFEFGTATGLTAGSIVGGNLAGTKQFDSSAGSPEIVATNARTGNWCLKLSATSAVEYVAWLDPGVLSFYPPTEGLGDFFSVFKFNFYFDTSLPSGDAVLASLEANSAANGLVIRYVSASNKIGVKVGTGSEVLSNAAVAANKHLGVSLRYNPLGTTHTCEWSMDYDSLDVTAALVAQTNATSTGMTWTTVDGIYLGWKSAQTCTVYIDDVFYSKRWGDYPIGKERISPLLTDTSATATVSGTSANFQTFVSNGTGTAFNGTTWQTNLHKTAPVVGGSATGAMQVAVGATDYVETPMETLTLDDKTARAVKWSVAPWAASGNPATVGMRQPTDDGLGDLWLVAAADHGADDTNLIWICGMSRLAGGNYLPMTKARVDGLKLFLGYSTDANPDGGWLMVLAEIAWTPAETFVLTEATGSVGVHRAYVRQDPISGAVAAYTVATAAGAEGAVLRYTRNGTPVTESVAAGQNPVFPINADNLSEITAQTLDVA